MITDPWFIAMAIPSVIMIGLSKGGFAGGRRRRHCPAIDVDRGTAG